MVKFETELIFGEDQSSFHGNFQGNDPNQCKSVCRQGTEDDGTEITSIVKFNACKGKEIMEEISERLQTRGSSIDKSILKGINYDFQGCPDKFVCPPDFYLRPQLDSLNAICAKCPDGQSSTGRQTKCVESCPAHAYRNSTMLTCKRCPKGWIGTESKIVCMQCEAGKKWVTAKDVPTPELARACDVCPPGEFQSLPGKDSCEQCKSGKYLPKESNQFMDHDEEKDCQNCVRGRYNPKPGQGDCFPCPSYPPTNPGSATCPAVECDVGEFKIEFQSQSRNNTYNCSVCPKGYFNNLPNKINCKICVLGQFSSTNGSVSCEGCDRGLYGNSNATIRNFSDIACVDCPAGRHNIYPKKDSLDDCEKCEAGKWSALIGASRDSTCRSCLPGRYGEDKGAAVNTSCVLCLVGYFNADIGSDSSSNCHKCPAGKYQGEKGAAYCLPCYPGRYQNVAGESICLECVPGRYSDDVEQKVCKNCDTGKHANQTQATVCFKCLPGEYNNLTGQPLCKKCPGAQYTDLPGKTKCGTPPTTNFVVGAGGSSLVEIAKGWYATTNNMKDPTLPCPAGKIGEDPPSDKCLQCPAGWSSFKGNLDCFQCEKGKFAPSEGSENCTKCDANSRREYTDLINATSCKVCDVNERSTGSLCISLGIDSSLEVPTMIGLWIKGTQKNHLFLQWSYGKVDDGHKLDSFEIDVSTSVTFEGVDSFGEKHVKRHMMDIGEGHSLASGVNVSTMYTFNTVLPSPAFRQTSYFRVSAVVEDSTGSRLLSNNPVPLGGWKTWLCPSLDKQYLNDTSRNPNDWSCRECPDHASCESTVTFREVKARFGYWRSIQRDQPATEAIFLRCVFAPACLGAPSENEKMYEDAPPHIYNLSTFNFPEQCNHEDGYLQTCANNETCRLCNTCRQGYAHAFAGGECVECPPADGAKALIAAIAIVSIVVISVLIFLRLKSVTGRTHVKTRAIHSTLKRILLTHMQVVTLVATLNVPWPRNFMSMVSVFSSASTMSQHLSALSCEMTRNEEPVGLEARLLYNQTIILIFCPPIVVLFLFLYWVVIAPRVSFLRCGVELRPSPICKMKTLFGFGGAGGARGSSGGARGSSGGSEPSTTQRLSSPTSSPSQLSAEGGEIKVEDHSHQQEESSVTVESSPNKNPPEEKMMLMSTRDTWVYSVSLISYIMYPTLVRFPFELLQCREVDGGFYLERDLEERCYLPGTRHYQMMWLICFPALMLYAIGMPLGSFVILWQNRYRLSGDKFKFRLGLLYSGYREDRWWWEVVVALRKVVIISLASFGFNDSIQVHLVLGLMLILLVCHYTFLPYDIACTTGELLHRVERNSMLCLVSMLWAGVVFIMGSDLQCQGDICKWVHNILVIVVVLINVILLCHGTYLFIYFFCKRQHWLEKIENSKLKKRATELLRRSTRKSNTGTSTCSSKDDEEVEMTNIDVRYKVGDPRRGHHVPVEKVDDDKAEDQERWKGLSSMVNPLKEKREKQETVKRKKGGTLKGKRGTRATAKKSSM